MKNKFVLLFYLLITASFVYAQDFEFSHLNSANGLSNNQVERIFRDSRGFMWFATNLGLNRYDGYTFKIYRHERNDVQSAPSDRFTSIQEDIDGNLWLLSQQTYTVYNYATESFSQNIDSVLNTYKLPPSADIVEIDENKNFYVYYKNKGIYRYNPQNKETTIYPQSSEGKEFISSSAIVRMQSRNNFLWVSHSDGKIERINNQTRKVDIRDRYFEGRMQNSIIEKNIFIDSENGLWVYPGYNDKGIVYLAPNSKEWTVFDDRGKHSLSNTFVRCVAEDNKGLIWIGTDHGGINILEKKTGHITVLRNEIYNQNSIAQNSVISLFCDNSGIVWAGTYKNGVSYYHPNMYKFKKPHLFYEFYKGEEIFDCNSFYKDNNQNLWIGTNGNGLIKYNENDGSTKRYVTEANEPNSISSNIITSIASDHASTLWIGTFFGGLNSFNGSAFTRYQPIEGNSNSLSNKSIYALKEDSDNNLWIGTLGGGIDQLDPSRKVFTRYNINNSPKLLSNYVLSMSTDPKQNIYVSLDRGINFIDSRDKQIKPYFEGNLQDSLTNITINYTYLDSRELMWIATNNGINVYNPRTQKFTYIRTKEGLPTDEVVSITEDGDGNIWAGTRNGLVCIHCEYSNQILNFKIETYNTSDGLPNSICNHNAIYKDNKGTIYVGFTNGYVKFDPKSIVFNKEVSVPRFTDLIISNQIIKPQVKYNGRVILEKTITELKEITLNYKETNFTIQFSSLDYIQPQKYHYKYLLEGLDNDWTEIKSGIGAASFSNLNAGKYKLIVYASNGDNVWTEQPLELNIIVKPPFWMSWWAIGIYLLIIVFLLRWFISYKLRKQKSEFEQAKMILEANKTHELDELKLRFFTNISHEFKTPLTLIITPLEKLLKSPDNEEQKKTLTIMYRNAMNLLKMVNEILDFRKLDQSKMGLNISKGDIIPFIKDIVLSFSDLANEKTIRLTFTSYIGELQMDFDKEKISKILTNLLANAFKYTEEGAIDVNVGISELLQDTENIEKQLIIKVSDTGIGINEKYKDKIFERFFRVENPDKDIASGTGVGLHLVSEYVKLHEGTINIESREGKGSVFTVTIPIHNSSYETIQNQQIVYTDNNIPEKIVERDIAKTPQNPNLPLLLIVDDNEDLCTFIEDLFKDNYRISVANDGEEACSLVLDQLPDIILSDVMMPKMDGYEFCRRMKADMRTSHIPIILLTAKSSEENEYSGIDAGADDFISKPFNIDILKLKIAKILEKQKILHNSFRKKIDISPSEIEITPMDEKFVKKAVSIVEENISNTEFLVEDLCKEMGMSRVYFYKKILALTDKSPSEFIRFIRLKRAADLLEKSQLYVNEIAFQVGFNDPKYFRKYFKAEFGVTPNEYKKNVSQ
ncbi:MAG: two-component regulator propeller domain-containing protein [Dysgonomonas sp.]